MRGTNTISRLLRLRLFLRDAVWLPLYFFICSGLVLPFLFVETCLADDAILEVLYFERPPYYVTKHDNPSGFLLERALSVMQKAGISVRTRSLPVKRILNIVKDGQENVVTVGWFKNDERLGWAKFSRWLYQDQPLVALHTRDSKLGLGGESTVDALLSNPQLCLGLLDGFSYGVAVDEKIRTFNPTKFILSGDQVQLIKMLSAKRVDYILVAPEEVSYLLAGANLKEKNFSFTLLTDMPEGNYRYLMYSRAVSNDVIQRIDEAIERSQSNDLIKKGPQ